MQFSLLKRPLMAAAIAAFACAGAASAVDYYYPNATSPVYYNGTTYVSSQPAVVSTSSCNSCPATVAAPTTYQVYQTAQRPVVTRPAVTRPAAGYCSGCRPIGPTQGLGRTNLPGFYSDDYDYHTSSQVNSGITYIVPNQHGYTESSTVPLANEVDRYYATHEVRNGQVVETGSVSRAGQNLVRHSDSELNPNWNRNLNETRGTSAIGSGASAIPATSPLNRMDNQIRRPATTTSPILNNQLDSRANNRLNNAASALDRDMNSARPTASRTNSSVVNNAINDVNNSIGPWNNTSNNVNRSSAVNAGSVLPATTAAAASQNASMTPGLNVDNIDYSVPGAVTPELFD